MTNKKLRVAMIIQAYHPFIGGAERQLGTIAPLLKERGVDVHILTRRYENWTPYELVDGIPVHRLPIPGPMPVASLSFTLTGLLMLRKLRPDIIHAHELLSPTTTAVAAKILFKTPIVAKVLGGGEMGDISKLRRNPISAIRVKTILKKVDMFITVSREIGVELNKAGIPNERQVNIPNGVNTQRFKPLPASEIKALRTKLGLPPGPLSIYTGRLDEEKNVGILVSTWEKVRQMIPQAHLLVAGTGSELEALKESAGEGVTFLGNVYDVAPYLQASDLFILPSLREGLSNALLEAMACGLPAVVTSVGGNPELITPDQNGLLVPPGDSLSLKNAIVELLEDKTRRMKMGKFSHQIILDRYDINRTVDQLMLLYQNISGFST